MNNVQPNDNFELFRELLESKFENLENKIESNSKLQSEISNNILAQTTKTNGRVTKLEDKIVKIQELESNHFTMCPRISEIKELNSKVDSFNTDLSEVRFIKKNPKITLLLASILVIYIICTVGYGVIETLSFITNSKINTLLVK